MANYLSSLLTATIFCLFHKIIKADASCILLKDCTCHNTTYKAYEYQCPTFIALLRNANDLKIRCNQSISQTEGILAKFELQKLTLLECPNLNGFKNAVNLDSLSIRQSLFMQNLLEQFENLTELEITRTQLEITDGLLSNNHLLKKVILTQNSAKTLPPNVFSNATNLLHLDLSGNEISKLPDEVFRRLRSLKYLGLANNKLENINSLVFYDLQNLEKIDLSHNAIMSVSLESFQRVVNLKIVDLSHNHVDFDGFSPFYSNLNLEVIDLSNNRISHAVDDFVINKIFLDKLDLSYNEISHIELSDLLAVSERAKIDLQNNKITSIEFTYADIIEQLTLLENHQLPMEFKPVITVNINNNPITCDCTLYDFIKYLNRKSTSIRFRTDQAKCAAPSWLNGFVLTKLKLESLTCELEQERCPNACHCNYRKWDKAVTVDCIGKNLTKVPDLDVVETIGASKIELHLQENSITAGPREEMKGYVNVTKLIMSRNKIENFTWVPPKLEMLDLEYNNINHLSYDTLLQMNTQKLNMLILGNNPWKCDCSAVVFNYFLVSEAPTKQIDFNKIQCSVDHKFLFYLNSQDLCPLSSSYLNITGVIVGLIVLGISAIIIIKVVYFSPKSGWPIRAQMV